MRRSLGEAGAADLPVGAGQAECLRAVLTGESRAQARDGTAAQGGQPRGCHDLGQSRRWHRSSGSVHRTKRTRLPSAARAGFPEGLVRKQLMVRAGGRLTQREEEVLALVARGNMQQGDRGTAIYQRENCGAPYQPRAEQAGREEPRRGGSVCAEQGRGGAWCVTSIFHRQDAKNAKVRQVFTGRTVQDSLEAIAHELRGRFEIAIAVDAQPAEEALPGSAGGHQPDRS